MMTIKCPFCEAKLRFAQRVKLVWPGYFFCPLCRSKLTTSIVSSFLVTAVVAPPVVLFVNRLFHEADIERGVLIAVGVTVAVLVSHLLSPLKLLVVVK